MSAIALQIFYFCFYLRIDSEICKKISRCSQKTRWLLVLMKISEAVRKKFIDKKRDLENPFQKKQHSRQSVF